MDSKDLVAPSAQQNYEKFPFIVQKTSLEHFWRFGIQNWAPIYFGQTHLVGLSLQVEP